MSPANEATKMDTHRGVAPPSSASAFTNANNTQITNSSLTVINNNNQRPNDVVPDPLKTLYERVAPNAILNDGGRADEVRCYPGTREEVIGLVERWMDGPSSDGVAPGGPNLMWLSGPAGAGKSAIVQTIAERCKERGVQAASFFFFRADTTRSTARPLVPTLLYQIFKFYPTARQAVAAVLSDDPLLFDLSMQEQFRRLLSSPALQDVPQAPEGSALRRPIVLLIDGLDECDSEKVASQKQILQALDRLLTQEGSPFLALVASRAEPHITMAVKHLSSPVQPIFLDDQYQPEKDIRLFVTAEFSKLKDSHHLAHTLAGDWPSDDDIESIVKKSSGQFIYAATVMRYLANSSASPKLSLERVQGLVPVTTNTPFAHLDAIYTYIFSRVHERAAVLALLSAELLNNSDLLVSDLALTAILHAYDPRYTPEFLLSCVADLTAVMQFDGKTVNFFHASLPDFLQDQTRAEEYFIDVLAFGLKILPTVWMMTPESMAETHLGLRFLQKLQKPPPGDLAKVLLTVHPSAKLDFIYNTRFLDYLFGHIHRLYYPQDVKTYKKILRQWVPWFIRLPQSELTKLENATRSLPKLKRYIQMAKIEYWVSNTLKAPFRTKK